LSGDTKFKNILIPLDGSEYSIKALDYATTMAKGFNSKLIALYIVPSSIRYNLFWIKKNSEINTPFNQIIQVSHMEAEKLLKDRNINRGDYCWRIDCFGNNWICRTRKYRSNNYGNQR
jgi:hypothetical protein